MPEVIVNPFGDGGPEGTVSACRTYRMDFEKKRITGMVDGLDSAAQSVAKSLMTRRFAHLIYDSQYGYDLLNKINNKNLGEDYLNSDIPAMTEDCLLCNDMVEAVEGVTCRREGDGIQVDVRVKTIFGRTEVSEVIK